MPETSVPTVVPFGLAVAARHPILIADVDVTTLVFDPDRQIMLVRDGDAEELVPWCKHSTGQTTTNSNTDGHGGNETDTDHTED